MPGKFMVYNMLMRVPWGELFFLFFVIFFCAITRTSAEPLKSTNYEFRESSLGGIGSNGAQSSNFQTDGTSGGIIGNGSSASSNYRSSGGNLTTPDPALTFAVTSSDVSFGSFSAGASTVGTSN